MAHTQTIPGADLLVVDRLSVAFGHTDTPKRAVNEVSFRIARSERVALVGESGSGKTTLALALAGFLLDEAVRIEYDALEFDGRLLRRGHVTGIPDRTPGITMVFQDAMTSLDPVWTIGSQFSAVLRRLERLSHARAQQRMEYWLTRVGLRDHTRVLGARPYELSGGMRQRAMLAIALSGAPKLLIADEPTSALDASLAREVMDLMVELTVESGTSLLIVTHDIELCRRYADRVLVMLNGHLVDDIPSTELGSGMRHPYTDGLLRCVPTFESAGLDELPTISAAERAIW